MFEFGDRFTFKDGVVTEQYMLVDLFYDKINLVNLKTGKVYTDKVVRVNDVNNITMDDIERLLGVNFNNFYWGNDVF